MQPEPQHEPVGAPPYQEQEQAASPAPVGTGVQTEASGPGLVVWESQGSFALRINYFFSATVLLLFMAMILASVSLNKTTYGWLVEKVSSNDIDLESSVSYGTLFFKVESRGVSLGFGYAAFECQANIDDNDDAQERAEKLEEQGWCEDLKSAAAVGRGFMQFAVIVTAIALLTTAFIVVWPLAYIPEPQAKPDVSRYVGIACVVAPAVLIFFAYFLFVTIFPHSRQSKAEEQAQEAGLDISYSTTGGEGMVQVIFAILFACGGCCVGAFGFFKEFM